MPRRPHLPRSRSRRRAALALALVVVLVAAAALAAGVVAAVGGARVDPAAAVVEQESSVPVGAEADGTAVALDVSTFTPPPGTAGADAGGRRAAVMLAHGFGGSKDALEVQARALAADGYVVLTWTARGFGASGGLIHLDSPDYEVADASVLIDVLAARDDVRLDGDTDPRVGIAGASYGGALALMAAGYDDRVDAIVPVITWNDLGRAFFPQDAAARGGSAAVVPAVGVFKQRWASLFFTSALAQAGHAARAGTLHAGAGAGPASGPAPTGSSAAGSPPTCAASWTAPRPRGARGPAVSPGCGRPPRPVSWTASGPRRSSCRASRTPSSASRSPTPPPRRSPRTAPRWRCAGSTAATTGAGRRSARPT